MTARPNDSGYPPALFGLEGELVSLRIAVEPKLLEDLLETLSSLDFPVNPQLYHRPAQVEIDFPAYADRIDQVRLALRRNGFDPDSLHVDRGLAVAGGA